MRRTFIVTLLILALATISLFSVDDTFNVTTEIALIGWMKVSSSAIGGNKVSDYTDSGNFTTLAIIASGEQIFEAYMTTLCNSRTGYTVTMSATPMTSAVVGSTTSHINYTVSCNGYDVQTTLASENAPTLIVDVNSLIKLTGSSHAISLSVDATTFDAAVAGSYTGTVTFTFAAT